MAGYHPDGPSAHRHPPTTAVCAVRPGRSGKDTPRDAGKAGWQAEEAPFIAHDEETLAMVINGAAGRYVELGTQRAAFVNYEKKQVYMMLEIYETVSQAHSQKLFDEFETDASAPVGAIGTQARSTAEMGGGYMVEYFQGRFFVRASVSRATENEKAALVACAEEISGKISKSGG